MLNKSLGYQGTPHTFCLCVCKPYWYILSHGKSLLLWFLALLLQVTNKTVASVNKEAPNTAKNTVVKFIILILIVWPYLEIESWRFFFVFGVIVVNLLKLSFQFFNWILFLIYTNWLQVIPENISCGTKWIVNES